MDIKILAEQFSDYSLYIKGYSKETIRRYKQIIRFFCTFANITKLEEVTQENVRALLLYGRTQRNWTPSTFIIYHKGLLVFFRWCIHQGYLKTNPADDIESPKLEKRLPAKLSKEDALKLLEIVYNYPYNNKFFRYRNHAIFAMFLFAGLRRSELIKMKYTDIDFENFSIFVRQGKGSKDRIVPMSYTLARSLQRYVEERRRLKKTCPEFFASLIYNAGLTVDGLKHLVRKLCNLSKMKFTVHQLRHTFATLMLEGGCDIYSLSKMMGHSDIKTTTIYLAASAKHLRGQIGKHPLNDLL